MSFLKHYIHLEHHFVLQKYAEKTASLLRKGELAGGTKPVSLCNKSSKQKGVIGTRGSPWTARADV